MLPNQVHFAVRILSKSKHERTHKQQMLLDKLLSPEPFYSSIKESYGEEGRRTFLRGVHLRSEPRLRHHNLHWLYVLYGSLTAHARTYRSGESLLLDEAQPELAIAAGSLVLAIDRDRVQKIRRRWEEKQQSREADQLRRLPFFSEMKPQQLQTLLRLFERRQYVRNGVVFEQGQLARELFVISSGSFSMRRVEQPSRSPPARPQHTCPKEVLLMVDADIFGEECLQFQCEDGIRPGSRYTCSVVCSSSEGALLCLDISAFGVPPLKTLLSLPDQIYHFYGKRREAACKAPKPPPSSTGSDQQAQLENYLEKVYRSRSNHLHSSYVQRSCPNPELRFLDKDQFSSMKMKLKYQGILAQVDKLNSLTQKTLSATFFSTRRPLHTYNRNADRERSVILKELNKERFKRDNFSEEVLNSIISRAEHSVNHQERLKDKPAGLSARVLLQKKDAASSPKQMFTPILETSYTEQDSKWKTAGEDSPIRLKTTNLRTSRFRQSSALNFIKKPT